MSDFELMTYVTLNEQVTLQNQDPVSSLAGLKPSLIDLEAYSYIAMVTRANDEIKDYVLRDEDASEN
jgi:hypothetical protein